MHLSMVAHDALIGESYRKALMLDIVSLTRGHKLTLISALANLDLTYVSRGAEADAVSGLMGKMHRKLVDNGVGVVRHQLLLVSGA